MNSSCALLECPRERRQAGRTAPIVLLTRQAVVAVVADLAFEVRMPFVDVEHGVPPCHRRVAAAIAVLDDAAEVAREMGGALPTTVLSQRNDLLRRAASS